VHPVLQALIGGADAVVPAVWRLEIVNSLVVAERRKKVTPEKSAEFILDLQQFEITVDLDGIDFVFTSVLDAARLHRRSAYDASYLELAKRGGFPLATKDEPRRKAAEDLGVELYNPEDSSIGNPNLR